MINKKGYLPPDKLIIIAIVALILLYLLNKYGYI